MPNVNPEILKWARETAGLSEQEATDKIGLKGTQKETALAKLAKLEAGEIAPSRAQLVKMSKQYRRPLLTFYLSEKPITGDRGEDYRTLPESISGTDVALVDVVIRDIRARQSLVRDVLIEEEDAEKLPFVASMKIDDGVEAVAASLAEYLKFDLQNYRTKNKVETAFAYLRDQAEEAGIFVILVDNLGNHYTTISVEAFRGFALADPVVPFIAINANDSRGAQTFTLVHELVHLWLGQTGVSGHYSERRTEKFCNDVASHFLVGHDEIETLRPQLAGEIDFPTLKKIITDFAMDRNISSTMIAYCLQRSDILDFPSFEKLRQSYRDDFLKRQQSNREKNREKDGGVSYHMVRRHRVGTGLIRVVERMMYSGALTTTKAGKVLGVKGKNVTGILEAAQPRVAH